MFGRALIVAGAALFAVACRDKGAPATTTPSPASAIAPPTLPAPPAPLEALEAPEELPPPARAVAPSELAGEAACGPFRTRDFEPTDRPLLNDRLRVRFLPGGAPQGGAESAKIEVKRAGATLFIGAREAYLKGDVEFERRAAKAATFGGGYEPVAVAGNDAKVAIVAGVLRAPEGEGDLVALAHGWFLDPNRDVLDVAVFASRGALADLKGCRRFAQKVLSTVSLGPRLMTYGAPAEVETKVSSATFRYRLPPDWALAEAAGMHDSARLHFRKRGVFPRGFTVLQLALDAHPGDWASPGAEEGRRQGRLLTLPVGWRLTREPGPPAVFGAWAVSAEVVNRDHAAASLQAASAADRDDALRFAESVVVVR
jgi:hypothetical protein